MAAQNIDYQNTIGLFASNIEGVLANIEGGRSSILMSNINILRTVIVFIGFKLTSSSNSSTIEQRGLFSLDAELHRIQNFLLQLAIDDADLVSPTANLPVENNLARALRLLKILINLSKYRVTYLHDSAFVCIDIMNSIGMIQPALHIPPNAANDDTLKNQVLQSFMQFCSTMPVLADNDGLDLELTFENADEYDCGRISAVFKEIDDTVGKNLNQFRNPDSLAQILSQFRKIAKSSKVGMLLKQSLKVGDDYLQIIDEEILRLLYEKNEFSQLVDVNLVSPDKMKVLGEGLMGRVIVGKVGQQAAAFKSLDVASDILKVIGSEGRNELMSELRLKWMNYNNENILSLHGVTLIDDRIIIAYELMQSDLETVLHHNRKKQVLSPEMGVEIILGVCKGLKFLHLSSIIHGNLHPGNILIRGLDNYGKMQLKNLRVKLSDFGTDALRRDLTTCAQVANPLLGIKIKTTEAYLAPEVLTDKKHTYSSDIYAVGIIGWEVGQDNVRPLHNVHDLVAAVVHNKVRPDFTTGSYKEWFKQFIQECWVHEPWTRPTAQDTQKTLEHEISVEISQNSGMQDFRGRAINTNSNAMPRIALPSGGLAMQRQSGSRLSRVRSSTQRANVRPSSQARTSVVLQKQRFDFLDNISGETNTDVGVKILKAMRFYMTDAELQVKGLVGLRLILQGGGNRQKVVGRMGAGLLAVKALQNHTKEVAVVEPAIGLIGNLSADYGVAESIMKSGGALAVVEAVKLHIKDEAVAEEALIAFTNLHQGDPKRQRFLIEIEVPALILEIMEYHSKVPPIIIEGFAAISYLHGGWYSNEVPCSALVKQNKKDYKKEGKRHWLDFFDLKAVDLILKGIKHYKEDKDIQAEGFSALAVVISGFDERRKSLFKTKFILPHMAKMMDRHGNAPEVVEASFALISQLTSLKICHKEVLSLNIHEYIIDAMKNYTEDLDENLQIAGIKALYNLSYKDKRTSKTLKNCGAIEAAIRARTLFPQNDLLVKAADALSLIIARGGRA